MLLQLAANVAGDFWLVVVLGRGVVGAAWATVASQLLGTAMIVIALQATAKVRCISPVWQYACALPCAWMLYCLEANWHAC